MSEVIKSYRGFESVRRHGIRMEFNKPPMSYPLHRHDYYEFEVIRSGSIVHELNGVRETLGPGQIVALSPKDLHKFTSTEPVEICNLCIYYNSAPSLVQRLLSSVKFPLRGKLSEEGVERLADHVKSAHRQIERNDNYEREILSAYTVLFLTEIFSVSKVSTSERLEPGYTHIAKAMEFISENFASRITLEDVAQSVHLTPSYFSKLFSEINGKSFVKYLIEQRIEHAKMLLATTDLSVTAIAFSSGFGSFSAFSRAFLTHSGMQPHEFRKLAREG